MLSAWLRINADGTVTLMIGKVELGQGILTAVTQICADELDVDIERIKIVSGDTAVVPNEGTTAGSSSMPGCAPAVQQASAEVRAHPARVRCSKAGPADRVAEGRGRHDHRHGWRKGDLLGIANRQGTGTQATGNVPAEARFEHRYIGKSVTRVDIPAKMTGEAIFLQEYRPEGMVHGRVVRPPTYKARLAGSTPALSRRCLA